MTSLTSLGALDPSIAAQTGAVPTTDELVNTQQFLQLLVAQLENQNPLEPLDGTDYVSQLAEFASLEQLTQVNTGLGDINTGQAGLLSQNSLMMLDRVITYPGNEVALPEEEFVELNYQLNGSAGDLVISVFDESGLQVGQIVDAPRIAGFNSYRWDGRVLRNGEEETVPAGSYTFTISAFDGSNPVPTQTFGSGRVTGVTYESGFPELLLGDTKIVPGEVLKVAD